MKKQKNTQDESNEQPTDTGLLPWKFEIGQVVKLAATGDEVTIKWRYEYGAERSYSFDAVEGEVILAEDKFEAI
jgi:hypothetical protein